jgi:hypothetical protein
MLLEHVAPDGRFQLAFDVGTDIMSKAQHDSFHCPPQEEAWSGCPLGFVHLDESAVRVVCEERFDMDTHQLTVAHHQWGQGRLPDSAAIDWPSRLGAGATHATRMSAVMANDTAGVTRQPARDIGSWHKLHSAVSCCDVPLPSVGSGTLA